jgi:arginine N-succinyltransferase
VSVFYVRSAARGDLPALLAVARHLDSVNLPNDEGRLAQAIARSESSFAEKIEPAKRELLMVLCERQADGSERAVGSSMIFAQHGSRRAPHIYFDVIDEERYSETLDRHFHHKILRLGSSYNGLTEIGGLVLLPELRGHAQQLGKTLVHVRFLYIAINRAWFRDEMVSELLPPLEADGTSVLWEALGRHFTGLSYQEADRLSHENKEFIRTLFPQDPIYASLLPPAAQERIGQVGPKSKPVERMLVRAGFHYAHRIDPFDGGPHFQARTDEVAPIKATRRLTVTAARPLPPDAPWAIVALQRQERTPPFLAVRAQVLVEGDGVAVNEETARFLDLSTGATVAVLGI